MTKIVDRYGRTIRYTKGSANAASGQLTNVTQVYTGATPASDWYQYQYTLFQSLLFLTTISVPSPTGTGFSSANIQYNASTLFVEKLTDANGNTREYSSSANKLETTVYIKNSSEILQGQYKSEYDTTRAPKRKSNSWGGTFLEYEYGNANALYWPTAVVSRADDNLVYRQDYQRDAYGNLLDLNFNSRSAIRYTYDYTYTSMPCGRATKQQRFSANVAYPAVTFGYDYDDVNYAKFPSPASARTDSGMDSWSEAKMTYDNLGNVTTTETPRSNVLTSDTSFRTAYINYNSDTWGNYTQAAAVGQPLVATDSLGHSWHCRYDGRGNLTYSWDGYNNFVIREYNLADQVQYIYFRESNQQGPNKSKIEYAYLYPGGPVASVSVYDENNTRVKQVSYNYGAEGELLSVSGQTPERFSQTFDSYYRVKTYKDAANNTTTYSYDLNENLNRITFPGGDSVQYTFQDRLGRPRYRTDGRGLQTEYLYEDPLGALSRINYPALAQYPGTQVVPVRNYASFTYDNFGRLTNIADPWSDRSFTYNAADSLRTAATKYPTMSASAKTISYLYNNDGSRASMDIPTDGRIPGALGGSGTFTYNYDLKGRMTGMTNPWNSIAAFTYWDNDWWTYNGAPQVFQSGYLVDGLRAFKTGRYFLYDGATPVVEFNSSGNVIAVNTFGPNGLISRRDITYGGTQTSPGEERYYLFDERGNTAVRLNGSGRIIGAGVTDAYGNTAPTYFDPTQSASDPFSGFGAQYGYYQDQETTQFLCGFRFYNPFEGRWLTRDPIGYAGGQNLYAYVSGNPIMRIDPDGKNPLATAAVGAVIGAGFYAFNAWYQNKSMDEIGSEALKGGIIGGVGGLFFGVGGGLAVGVGAPAWLAGVVGGATGSTASQATAISQGWQQDFSWTQLGVSAAAGGILSSCPTRVTHWGYGAKPQGINPGNWVETGGRTPLGYLSAGGPQAGWGVGNGISRWVNPNNLRAPWAEEGWHALWKSSIGQRIYTGSPIK